LIKAKYNTTNLLAEFKHRNWLEKWNDVGCAVQRLSQSTAAQ